MKLQGEVEVLLTYRISFTLNIVISLALDIYGLFRMLFDYLWVVVDVFEVVFEFFEVVVDGFRWL